MTRTQTKTAALTEKADTKPAEIKVECPSVSEVVISYDASAEEVHNLCHQQIIIDMPFYGVIVCYHTASLHL